MNQLWYFWLFSSIDYFWEWYIKLLSQSCWCALAGHQMSLCVCLSTWLVVCCWCHVLSCLMSDVTSCVCYLCLPACFSPSGGFCLFLFLFNYKKKHILLHLSPCLISLHATWQNQTAWWGLSGEWAHTVHQPLTSAAHSTNASSNFRPWAPSVSRALTWGSLPLGSVG